MSSSTTLPPDASARLAMLAEMLERSSKSESEGHSESGRRDSSRGESTPRKSK